MKKTLLLISSIIVIFISCKKNSFITSPDAAINFSMDTLSFDTVFTSTGSVTQSVKIINANNQKINLSEVKLMGGSNSPFKININGASVSDASNIEIDADDSIYVFVSVYVNPTSANLAFILQDSIMVAYNGNTRFIQLQAYGQNAHFLLSRQIMGNTTWVNDLPYVILGGLAVDSGSTLTIQSGCRIYSHANAPIIVDGTLIVQGQKYDSTRVYFQSDRLDQPYASYPAGWPGIYFAPSSKDNVFEFGVVNNAYQAIVVLGPSLDANPKLVLDECIINNSYDAGLLAQQSSIQARNCLITNCGANVELTYGGTYAFSYCTVASYSNEFMSHTNPVLTINNVSSDGTNATYSLSASFDNCIFWGDGSLPDEVSVSKQQTSSAFGVNFNYCLWLEKDNPSNVTATNMLATDPMFDSVNNLSLFYDFHLKASSPAIGAGTISGAPPFDLDGNPRVVGGLTDLGCFQKQ
ncbi:MAG TPA: choice-of-anchor Q domain-containing protein [Puia sp.]|nr:choice-of-anchor Q domain-containing protein [Puia sp.]